MPEPAVSAVIAAWPDHRGLEACLAALAPQAGTDSEIIVAATAPPGPGLQARFPGVTWAIAPECPLIPHLWAAGIGRARGTVVALTTAHFLPAEGWLAAIRASHQRLDAAGIAGPIHPPRGRDAVAWATYFTRYSAYLAIDEEREMDDLAGDNASYKRADLDLYADLSNGFWEQEFHRRVLAAGRRLRYDPALRVTMHESFGFPGFVAQRFRHGRHFGRSRVRGRGVAFRLAAAAGSPLVPAILLVRFARRVLAGRGYVAAFARCLPVLTCFVLAWAAGEATGYLLPASPDRGLGRHGELSA